MRPVHPAAASLRRRQDADQDPRWRPSAATLVQDSRHQVALRTVVSKLGYKDTQSWGCRSTSRCCSTCRRRRCVRPGRGSVRPTTLYGASADSVGLTNGAWGIFRSYDATVPGLTRLPNNPEGFGRAPCVLDYEALFNAADAAKRPTRAASRSPPQPWPKRTAARALARSWMARVAYNPSAKRPNGLVYVLSSDLDANGVLKGRASKRTTDSEGQRRRVAEVSR